MCKNRTNSVWFVNNYSTLILERIVQSVSVLTDSLERSDSLTIRTSPTQETNLHEKYYPDTDTQHSHVWILSYVTKRKLASYFSFDWNEWRVKHLPWLKHANFKSRNVQKHRSLTVILHKRNSAVMGNLFSNLSCNLDLSLVWIPPSRRFTSVWHWKVAFTSRLDHWSRCMSSGDVLNKQIVML